MPQLDHLPRLLDQLESRIAEQHQREKKLRADLDNALKQEWTKLGLDRKRVHEAIGAAVKRERLELGVRQGTLAKALGIQQASLAARENPGYNSRWNPELLANAIAYLRSIREQRPRRRTLRQALKELLT
jgi:DNA-binding XRE family transcriptional regulator